MSNEDSARYPQSRRACLKTAGPDRLEVAAEQAGFQQAIMAGDPSQPGLYVVLLKLLPGHMNHPHFHPNDRFITVIKGTWWVGTGTKFDPDSTVGNSSPTSVSRCTMTVLRARKLSF